MAAPIYPHKVAISAPGPHGESLEGKTSTASFTRPNNTTAYTAGDAVGAADAGTPANAGSAILEFTDAGPTGQSVLITNVDLRIDVSAIPSGMTTFRLYLYNEAPAAILDNAAWDFVAGDRGKLLGYVDLGNILDLGSTLFLQAEQVSKQVKLKAGSTSLFGVLVTNGGYTPTASAVKTIRIRTLPI